MSIQSLILITVDRFGAVVVPIRSPLISKKHCPFFIIASWIVAVAAYSHICILSNLLNTLDGWQGARDKYHLRTFTKHLAVTIAFFYISLVLLITLYAIILIKLKKHTHPGEHSANAVEQRSRRNWDVLNMAFVTFFVFFLCWIPPFLSGQYYILHRTVAFGSLAILYHTITLTTSWSPQTAPSNGLCASFLAVIIASI